MFCRYTSFWLFQYGLSFSNICLDGDCYVSLLFCLFKIFWLFGWCLLSLLCFVRIKHLDCLDGSALFLHCLVWVCAFDCLDGCLFCVYLDCLDEGCSVLYSESCPTKDSLWVWNQPSDHAANTATKQTFSIYIGNYWKQSSNKPVLSSNTANILASAITNKSPKKPKDQIANWQTNQPIQR